MPTDSSTLKSMMLPAWGISAQRTPHAIDEHAEILGLDLVTLHQCEDRWVGQDVIHGWLVVKASHRLLQQ
jgi:hypothetical protein